MPQFTIVQKDNDQLGTDIWRLKDLTIPMAYRTVLTHSSRANAQGTNYNQTVEVVTPIVRLVDGLAVSTDAFKATFKFSALQHVVNDEERALTFDALFTYLQRNRDSIIAGSKQIDTADFVIIEVGA